MRIAFVVQRCGAEVNGGAESLCLQIAQRMSRHWETEILTTCAIDYMRWENFYAEGEGFVGGVKIRRFVVDAIRDVTHFDKLSGALLAKGHGASIPEQEEWMRAQGPLSSDLLSYIEAAGAEYDAFIFFGYLYATTYFGLPLVRNRAWLVPLGHDEWPIHLEMWDRFFALPKGFVFQTPEELAFLRARFPSLSLEGPIAGIGVDTPLTINPGRFREKYGLDGQFLLYAGRIDASKGCAEMFDYFLRLHNEYPFQYKLVVMGKEVMPVPFHDQIISLGFVSDEEKWDAMAACDWLVLPSPYESLSISLLETWSAGRPAIVNGNSDVLVGHCRRGNGGLWYESWEDYAAICCNIKESTRRILGKQGQEYVKSFYSWNRVESCYLKAVMGDSEDPNQAKFET